MYSKTSIILAVFAISLSSACAENSQHVAQQPRQPQENSSNTATAPKHARTTIKSAPNSSSTMQLNTARSSTSPAASLAPTASIEPTPANGPAKATIQVRGMSCPLCAHNIEQQLTKLTQVSNVQIDLGKGEVLADVTDSSEGTKFAMKQAIQDAGFTAMSVSMSGSGR